MPIEPPVTSPRDLEGAYAALAAAPADAPARPIAGGTDLMVALTGELGEPPASVVDLWAIDALRGIAIDGAALVLGALTTYTDIRRSPLCREHVPALVDAAATIGAAQIQNRGTLGGNIANASPAGDTLPVLLAADAVFVLGSGRGERDVPAADFWTAYRRTALAPDELRAPHPDPARDRPRDALPQGRDASGAVDQQGRDGGGLAVGRGRGRAPRRVARRPGRPRVRGGHPDPCPRDGGRARRQAHRPPRPRTSPRRPWPASCHRSRTSVRPPSTAGSWRLACSIASFARPAAGDRSRRGPGDPQPRCSKGRHGSSRGWTRPGRSRTTRSSSRGPAPSPTRCRRPSRSSSSTRTRGSGRRPGRCRR